MAWEWSHTNEAYAYAEACVEKLSAARLKEIWAEIQVWKAVRGPLSQELYESKYKEAAAMLARDKDSVVASIWEFAAEFRTCDNGGWNAWLCPYGCAGHKVPFGPGTKQ
jgi:hypothetical protein